MPISKEQVAHVAELAGLKLTPEEQHTFSRELSTIIDYMDRLRDIGHGIRRSGAASPGRVFRDDVVGASLPVQEALRNAPETRDSYVVVPRVI